MHPIIRVGSIEMTAFGPLLVIAFLLGLVFAERRARRAGFEPWTMVRCATFILAGAWLGCRLVPLAVAPDGFLASPRATLRLFTSSAGAWYGGFLGGVGGLVLACRARALPTRRVLDVVAPAIALGKVIGPFACLVAGCDHGSLAPEWLPWAVVYASDVRAVAPGMSGVPLHPAPLYDSLANLAILGVLLQVERRRIPGAGRLFLLYCALYGVARFFIEEFRGDASRGLWFGGALSTSQILSIAIVAVAIGVDALFRRRSPEDDRSATLNDSRSESTLQRKLAAQGRS